MSLNIKSKKFKLSSTQLSVYVDQFLNPESSNYNIGVSFEVHSVFDNNKFERTLRQLVIKLDSLRLKFTMDGSEVYQEHIDVTENLTDYIEFVEEDYLKDNQGNDVFFTKLFNLEKSTWRARIVRSDDHNWQWDFCCHHLIADGHSLTNVLINEFIITYVSDDTDSCEESKEKPLSYEDFVHDDMEYINSIRYLKDKNFWSNLLQDIPPRLLLPIDETHSKGHVGHAGSLEWEFDGKLYLDIIDKCSQYDCTFTQFIYSTLACYYYRITGCSDIVIGIPLHNRKKASHKKIMGMFSSLTPVLINICETDCFTDILYKTKIAMRSCYKHQNFPLSGINQTINLRKNTGRSQVFDISLSYEVCDTFHSNKNLEISLRKVHRGTHLPLAIAINSYAIEGVDKIYIDFSYLLEYFTIEDIKLFKSRFINIIKSAYGSFDKPIKDLELIDGEEYDRVVYKYNHLSVANTNSETLIHTLFEEQVRRSPEAVALLCGDREVSYDALNRQANRIAHRLIALGVRPGDRVALCAERSAAAVAGILGILKSGAAYVPLDPEYPEDRLRFMLEDAAPAALLTEGRLTGILPGNTPVVLLGDAAHAEEPRDWELDPDASARGLTARSLAYIIYTSGSTGRPKGVMVEHGNITRLFLNTKDKFHFDSKDTWSLFHSLSFDFSVWELWGALSSGGRLVIVDKICTRSPGDFYALLHKHKVTILSQTPSYFRQIIFHKDQKKLFLRCVILGGEALDCGSLSSWVKVHPLSEIKLVNMYGITEITVHATYHEITQRDIDAPTRKIVGRPIYDLGIYILDGSGQPAPVGVPGEIYIGGAGVARGYHNLPELTDARFLDDPFTARGEKMYRSGDVGRWLADGNIEYLGRNDAQVKLRGFRIEPGEVDAALLRCDGVLEARTCVREDAPGDRRLVSYVLAEDGAEPRPAALRSALAGRLPEYMLPEAFVTLAAFPVTPNGKLDYAALPAPELGARVSRAYEAPLGRQEVLLAGLWAELLGVPRVGRQDNFFELGGHSLLLVTLTARLRLRGLSLAARAAFSSPVLADMARELVSLRTAVVPPDSLIPDGCQSIAPAMLPMVALSAADISQIARQAGGAANVQDVYPLAPLQAGILFHHMLEKQGDIYIMQLLLSFDGRPRLERFLTALQEVIDRHDILRTAFCWQSVAQPVQVVCRRAELRPGEHDLQDRAGLLALTDPRRHRLDLTQAPLLAADAAQDRATGEWLLVLRFHHLIVDHVTLDLMFEELNAVLAGRGDELPPAVPYRNFIARTLAEPAAEHERYFRDMLGDVDEPTAPFGAGSMLSAADEAGEAVGLLDASLSRAVRAQAALLGTSPGVLFHLAWALVLAKTSGREDVVFGTVLLGRMQGGSADERMMGLLVNTLPIRIRLAGAGVSEAIRYTADALGGLLEHEQASLAMAQRCSAVDDSLPLFSALFNYRHSEAESDSPLGEGVRLLSARERSNYPVGVSVDDLGSGFRLVVQASAEIGAQRVLGYLEQAVASLVAASEQAPERPVLELSVMPADERAHILDALSGGGPGTQPDALLVHTLFEEQVRRTPDAVALLCGNREVSYDALNRQANRIAHRLIALGVRPGDRVALCAERSAAAVAGILGALKSGAAYVPLDPEYPEDRLRFMLEDAAPAALLTEGRLTGILPGNTPVVLLGDADPAEELRDWEHDPDASARGLTARSLAYIIYTSGSTGRPKGVMVEHAGVCNLAQAQIARFGVGAESRVLQFASPSFDASVSEWCMALLCGASLVIADRAALLPGDTLNETLSARGVTHVTLPPVAAGLLPENGKPTQLAALIVAGEACPASLVEQWAGRIHMFNAYGPTEGTVCATVHACSAGSGGLTPIGRPIQNVRVYILDGSGQPAPLGVPGEIYIGGAGVARGYHNLPELTDARFLDDPFTARGEKMYRSGDVGRWLADGNIEYLGRNDAQVKLRGFRIEPGEVDAALLRCDGVLEARTCVREDAPGDRRLVSYVLAEGGAEPRPAALRSALAGRLPEYMLPEAFVTLAAFPVTPNGKLDYAALPAPELGARVSRAYEAPLGRQEVLLAGLWAELLGVPRVGRQDNFFELGGHSLLLVTLTARLGLRGLSLAARAAFSSPVLADMARELVSLRTAVVPPDSLIPDGCQSIAPAMLPMVALSAADISQIARQAGGAANVQDVYPLAPLQAGILFHHMLEKQGDIYVSQALFSFDGRPRLERFLTALQEVIDRHDILRTAFCWQSVAQPVQVVCRRAELRPGEHDLQDRAGLLALTDPRRHRLDLTQAPLLAADAAQDRATGEWLLVLRFHHLIVDHVTLDLMFEELNAVLAGRGDELPPAVPYRNFIARTLAEPAAEHERYFRDMLGDVDEPTAPFGAGSMLSAADEAGEAVGLLDASLSRAVRAQAALLGTSPGVLFHLAWALVLAKTSGREDVVFGTVLLGRMQGGSADERMMGLLVNTLPIRIRLAGAGVSEAIRYTADALGGLLEHEQASLAMAQRCSAVDDSLPLFSALFNYRHSEAESDSPLGEGVRLLSARERSNYPVGVSVDDLGSGFRLVVQASAEIGAQRVLGYLEQAVASLVAASEQAPERPVLELSVMPADERAHILDALSGGGPGTQPDALLVHTLFEEQVRRTPDAVALLCGNREVSYDALNRQANRIAHRLIALGVRPGDRVALCAERSAAAVAGILGALKSGAAYVPLDPEYPEDRLRFMLEDAAPAALLTEGRLTGILPGNTPVVLLGDADPAEELRDWEHDPDASARGLTARSLAYIIYTSGSTGRPKGVMVEHAGVCNLAQAQIARFGVGAESRVLQFASPSFDASVSEWCMALLCGASLVIADRAALLPGDTLNETLSARGVTHVTLPPVAAGLLPENGKPTQLAALIVAGEACPASLVEQWAGRIHMFNAYGPTEGTVCATVHACSAGSGGLTPIGRPIQNVRVYILDGSGQPAPLGVPGEIYIGGAGVARGYHNLPELTDARFLDDPFTARGEKMYRSGDVGRWLADGNIEYLGRNDAQVKLRGFRIEPGEVDAALLRCDGVLEARTCVREDAPGDRRLVSYVLAEGGAEPRPAALRSALAGRLPEYMLPEAFVTLAAFPVTPNGKLDYAALPAPELGARVSRAYEAPLGRQEVLLAGLWAELLGVPRVGRQDNFFELGGHSLLLVTLTARLGLRGLSLAARAAFSSPVLADMARELVSLRTAVVPPDSLIPDGCQSIAPAMLPMVALSAADISQIARQAGGAANVQDVYPLAPLQAGILFHHMLEKQGDIYVSQALFSFDGRPRLERFLTALQEVIDRHDILRTAFCWQSVAQPVQVVCRRAELRPGEHDLQDRAGLLALTDPRRHRLDLTQAPLLAADAAQDRATGEWLLVLRFHHLIVDHVTLDLMFEELNAVLAGRGDELPPAVPYRNFIARTLAEPAAEHERYFRDMLGDVDEPTAPFGAGSMLSAADEAGEAVGLLDASLSRAVRAQAALLGTSPGVLFHLAWALVLAKTSGREDVVFGTVLLGRMQGGSADERMMGLLVNTLPIRIRLAGAGVSEAIRYTADALGGLLEHEQASLAMAQRCSAVDDSLPLFSALFNYRHSEAESDSPLGEGVRLLSARERSNYPVGVSVDDLGSGFRLVVQASAEIGAQRVLGYLEQAVASLVAASEQAPERPVLELSVMPADERAHILDALSGGGPGTQPDALLVHTLFEEQVRRTPDAVALLCGNREVSYDALNRQANRIAHRLIALGVRPGDRVALCAERSAAAVAGILGALKSGAAYVPLDPEYPEDRLRFMLEDAAPAALLTEGRLTGILPGNTPVVLLGDADPAEELRDWEHDPDASARGLTARSLAYIIYTSGSTGRPKGVMVEHAGVCNLAQAQIARFGVGAESRVLQFASPSFDASVFEWCMALLCGASLVIADRAALLPGDTLNETLSARGVTHVTLPPVAAGLLPENGKPTQLAALIVAGEACPASLVEQWAGRIHMFNAYGPTEGTVCATVHACSAGSGGLTPIGRPIQNVRVYILDGSGQPAPLGVPGEIYIGGAGVARGYHNLPELTDARFLDDPFTARGEKMYRSGDVGRWLADGNIEYLGRNDAQVKLRGFRIEPGEVDAALLRCDGVLEARTCVREDAPGDRRLVSYVLAEDGAEPRPAALRSALAGRLPEYMLPEAFVTLAAFPVTPNGKLDYAALPAPELGARVSRAYEAPLGRQEVLLAGLWAELLGVPRVGRQDNFFELGGNSIKAVVLLSKLRTNNYDVGLRDLLINPTLRKQAGVIRVDNDPLLCCELKNPVEIKEGAGDTPLFMVHESTGEPMVYSRLSSLLNDSIPVYILHALGLSSSDTRPSTLSELAKNHFERIKSVQPSGPYRILGWSLGGLLSLEIAKKIIDGGDCISFLGMVDTYYSYDNIEVVREVIHSKVPGKQIEHKRALVPNDTPLVMDIVDKAISSGFIEEDKRNEYLNNICYLTNLAKGYTSNPIAVDLVLYAASLENAEKIDRGWGSIIKGRLTVMEIPADHFSIMGGVNVEKIASSINKILAP